MHARMAETSLVRRSGDTRVHGHSGHVAERRSSTGRWRRRMGRCGE